MAKEFSLDDTPFEKDLQNGDCRVAESVNALKQSFADSLFYMQGKHPHGATRNDGYMAVAYSVRDRLFHRALKMIDSYLRINSHKIVCFFSAEYLPGPHLAQNLVNLNIYANSQKALAYYDVNLDDLLAQESEPGLGNGGLGRLAACYMDSLATLEVPAIGYGIRYEFGIFEQEIRDGWQVEKADKWLKLGNPWEVARPETYEEVKLGGRTEAYHDEAGNFRSRWIPERVIKGVAYDTPVLGYEASTCNFMRLWKADAVESFDLQSFNVGDYYKAVEQKMFSENITKVLYPNDEAPEGKRLRLEQQYFFVSCSLQNMIRILKSANKPLDKFHETFAAQLNDTHPAIAIAELMRLLVDDHQMDWNTAWDITQKTFGYTNHTLLPEALEKWPLALFAETLPRPLEIIYEINRRFLDEVKIRFPGDTDRLKRMSIIEEVDGKFIRMAYLATIGSHSINGVAKLHTQLLKKNILPDFVEMWPDKFNNKTNGVSPRRFLVVSNPELTELIESRIGKGWIKNLDELHKLENFVDDANFQDQWSHAKHFNKHRLATTIKALTGISVNPESMFDIQVKRIHEYKRQHLNVLHIITLYNQLRNNPGLEITPRTFIFGGKAAPGYYQAKLIIKLINSVAEVINHDPIVRDRLKVVFFPNFNVTNGQKIYPAADLSEQISTAGTEASGTGNMKFAINGALTIGTLDGANIEIRDEIGHDNFFLFGLNADQIQQLKAKGYSPALFYNANPQLREAIELIRSGYFSGGNRDIFKPLLDVWMSRDPFMVFADYQSYIDCQEEVGKLYRNKKLWTQKSILTTARMGKFSSDRAIKEYCDDIWKAESIRLNRKADNHSLALK